jgi:hypothetical protein
MNHLSLLMYFPLRLLPYHASYDINIMSCVLQHCCKLHQIAVDRAGKLTRGDTAVMADIKKKTILRCHSRSRSTAELELELRLTRQCILLSFKGKVSLRRYGGGGRSIPLAV